MEVEITKLSPTKSKIDINLDELTEFLIKIIPSSSPWLNINLTENLLWYFRTHVTFIFHELKYISVNEYITKEESENIFNELKKELNYKLTKYQTEWKNKSKQ